MSGKFEYATTANNEDGDGSSDIDVKPLIEPFAICLIVMGIILLVVAVLGVCGACYNSRCVLAVVSL